MKILWTICLCFLTTALRADITVTYYDESDGVSNLAITQNTMALDWIFVSNPFTIDEAVLSLDILSNSTFHSHNFAGMIDASTTYLDIYALEFGSGFKRHFEYWNGTSTFDAYNVAYGYQLPHMPEPSSALLAGIALLFLKKR